MPQIHLGRVFRKLGLPPWTLAGVGISAIWFTYLGSLAEKLLRDLLKLNPTPANWVDYLPPLFVFLLPFLVVIMLGLWQESRRQASQLEFADNGLQKPEEKRGLILLVSNPESAMFAIAFHSQSGSLQQVWLLPSDGRAIAQFGVSTIAKAEEIKQRCEQQFPGVKVNVMERGVSPGDSQDTFDLVNQIYRRSGYEPQELIADFTGGTKPMSVGMIMACLPSERELEYVSYTPETRQMHGPYRVDYQHKAFDLIG